MTADATQPVFPDAKFTPGDFAPELKQREFWLSFQWGAGAVLIAGGILSAVKAALGIQGLGGQLAVLYTPPVCYVLSLLCVLFGAFLLWKAHHSEVALQLW